MKGLIAVSVCLVFALGVQASEIQTSASPVGSCSGVTDLSAYTIQSARVSDPFWFLRWRKLDADVLDAVKGLEGNKYSFSLVNRVSQELERKAWLPDNPNVPVSISFSDIAVENCEADKLDVVFHIFSAQMTPVISTVIESRSKEKQFPSEASGVANPSATVQFSPEAGYNAAEGLFPGGRMRLSIKNFQPVSAWEVKGYGSAKTHMISHVLSGRHDSNTGWLGEADWRLGFSHSILPVGTSGMKRGSLELQLSGISRIMHGFVLRFGGSLSGGNLQSTFRESALADNTIASSGYTSTKVYGGISGRMTRQAFAASYGLNLGSNSRGFHGDWRKHVADVVHEFWIPFGDHRIFELEQRFTAGGIQMMGRIPAGELFFGGNREVLFSDLAQWPIRANPVVRSIPASRLYLTEAGAGADRFYAYNSTVAFTLWRRPVVPRELSEDETFHKLLKGQVGSARSVLDVVHQSKDPNFQSIKESLPELGSALAALEAAQDRAQDDAPPELKEAFEPCSSALGSANLAVKNAIKNKPYQALGWVKEMLPGGDNSLSDVISACGDLAAAIQGASLDISALETSMTEIRKRSDALTVRFRSIDTDASKAKAEADLSFVDRVLDLILKEMNISSISPIIIFDVAGIGTKSAGYGGNRYAIGGGIRLTLLSTVSFTGGYAVNPRRKAGEGTGALFFSITTRNLF